MEQSFENYKAAFTWGVRNASHGLIGSTKEGSFQNTVVYILGRYFEEICEIRQFGTFHLEQVKQTYF